MTNHAIFGTQLEHAAVRSGSPVHTRIMANNQIVVFFDKCFCFQGTFAHAGFPEIAFGRYSDTLIQKGYK